MEHGVKRVRYSREALEAKEQRDRERLKEFLSLTEDVLAKKKSRDYTQDAFNQTTQLLRMNPEFYTIWNYRRDILILGIFPSSSPEVVNNLLQDDLSLTTTFLKLHPKVYWIWNHRRWCLQNVPDGPSEESKDGWRDNNWNKELYVVEKMLEVDARNFHAWDYRRYILANMRVPRSEVSELEYTSRKIAASFSNFSAWHQRSKILTSLWASGELDPIKSKDEEFDLLRNAMYTDPDDQSVWIYHAWLVTEGNDKALLNREIESIQELLDEQPDSKWCMESLVRYKRLLLQKHPGELDEEEKQGLHQECHRLLQQLVEIDPPRRRRYEEIAQTVALG